MTRARRWARRLRLLLRRDAIERSMDAELRHHIDCETAERIGRGMSPDEARRAALRDFGGIEAVKERARDARGARSLEDLGLDIRYAVRLLRRHGGLTSAAVLTFALGVGAATAIFSVVYGVLLRPLPYAHPERLVALWERNIPQNKDRNVVSVENFEVWRDRGDAFEVMAALVPRAVTLTGSGAPERVQGAEVSPGYFEMLGVAPAVGRTFTSADAAPGAAGALILSDGFWRRRFGGDPDVVGRTLTIAGERHAIVGVMPPFEPPRFGWLGEQQLWFPFVATAQNRAWGRFLLVIGRLRPDVPLERARAAMRAIAEQRARETAANAGWSVTLTPLAQQITGDVRTALMVLLGAAGMLLAMAVTNVATLMLSLSRRRTQELAMRRAMGATGGRIFRQLFTQSALLGALGGAVGVLTAPPAVHLLRLLLPPNVPRIEAIRVDAPVLAAASVIAMLATLAFGTVASIRGRSAAALSPGGLATLDHRPSARAGSGGLVSAEIALALALGLMALLMARSFAALRSVDLGVSTEGVLLARVALPADRYASAESQRAFFDALVNRVETLPGVQAAGVISTRPFGGLGVATTVTNRRQPASAGTPLPVADVRYADAGVFRALQIRRIRGAAFDDRGSSSGAPQAVISEAMARTLWPDGDPIGHELTITLFGGIDAVVIGIVGDVHLMDARTPPRPTVYLSASRFPSDLRDLVVRVDGAPDAFVRTLQAAVAALEPTLPLYQVTPLPRLVETTLAADRFTAWLLGAFAAVAIALAAVGVFGVFSADVVRRRKEIGLRLALGAGSSRVVAMLLRQSLGHASAGILAGTAMALLLARAMASLLFGVQPADPISFVTMACVLLGVAGVATLIPALHAIRMPPVTMLRDDS